MQQQLFLLIILLKSLLIKSEFTYSYGPINLDFYYSDDKYTKERRIPITTRPLLKNDVANSYILMGDVINDRVLFIRAFNCTSFRCSSCGRCGSNFISSNIILQNMLPEDHVLKLESKQDEQKFSFILSYLKSPNRNNFNLTCVIFENNFNFIDKPTDPSDYPLSKTSLFGIIFLCACIVLVFVLCFAWFTFIYYRRFTQYRMKKKLRKALIQSTQQMLEKSPVIIYDPNNKKDYPDDDPMCAICLEPFKSKEKLRKLVCSHYFHTICIDPWLLSRQSCPLCNRNILRNSIPSISSSIMGVINERNNNNNNEESTSIPNNDNIQTFRGQNVNL